MTNLDRFRPPEPSEESTVECDQCCKEVASNEAHYDESLGNFFCDFLCFYEWADRNSDVVADYYYEMNIE